MLQSPFVSANAPIRFNSTGGMCVCVHVRPLLHLNAAVHSAVLWRQADGGEATEMEVSEAKPHPCDHVVTSYHPETRRAEGEAQRAV